MNQYDICCVRLSPDVRVTLRDSELTIVWRCDVTQKSVRYVNVWNVKNVCAKPPDKSKILSVIQNQTYRDFLSRKKFWVKLCEYWIQSETKVLYETAIYDIVSDIETLHNFLFEFICECECTLPRNTRHYPAGDN